MFSRLPLQARFALLGARYGVTLGLAVIGNKMRGQRVATAMPRGRQRPCMPAMNPSDAILVCDQDASLREALRNFLLAAGYSRVEVAPTAREALPRLRRQHYRYVLIGVSRPFSRGWRLASIARQRQREAKIFFLVDAKDHPFVQDASRDYVIKEYVFSNLLELM